MISAIVTALLPVLIQLVALLIEKYIKNEEAIKKFQEFVAQLELGGLKSVGLHESYREQIERYKKKKQSEMPKIQ